MLAYVAERRHVKCAFTLVPVRPSRLPTIVCKSPQSQPSAPLFRRQRHKAEQERREVLLKRRKQFQQQLRLQEEEAAAARAISAEAREAYHQRELASRRLKKATDERESRR